MRGEIEPILLDCVSRFGPKISVCESQSLKAKQSIEALQQLWSVRRILGESLLTEERLHDAKTISKLQDFLAVHRAVALLEYHTNCANIERIDENESSVGSVQGGE